MKWVLTQAKRKQWPHLHNLNLMKSHLICLNITEEEFIVIPNMLKIFVEESSLLLIVIALITYILIFAIKFGATLNVIALILTL